MQEFVNNIKILEVRIEKLEQENEILKIENQVLKTENSELKEKLGLNSKNSNLPSSKDLYRMKREARKSSRSAGEQLGHKGVTRNKMKADEVIKIELENNCECGGKISKSKKPYVHQKVDIPEIKPYVVEYQIEHGRCIRCGKRKSGNLPKEVSSDTFGPKTKSIISALSGFYKNSKREIANILRDVFNLNISVGSISNAEEKVMEKCNSVYNEISYEVRKSNVLHIDETSHYQKVNLVGAGYLQVNRQALLSLPIQEVKRF